MTTQIKVLRENVIKTLTSIKDDNISIADIAIDRKALLSALKLQNHADADMLTIKYGKVSWREEGKYGTSEVNGESCIQIACNHTIMRFLNRPTYKRLVDMKVTPLNFVDQETYTKPELTGTPLDTQELIKALSFVLPCVNKDEMRPVLACVLFDSGNNTLKLVSADGFRLTIVPMPASGIPQDKVLIHHTDIRRLLTFLKAIKPIGKGKGKYYPEAYLSYDCETMKFSAENGSIELGKKTGNFPNYALLIPKEGIPIEFISNDMLQAVKSLANIANDGSGTIQLQFKAGKPVGKILITAKSEEYATSTVECDAIVKADCRIAVNYHYLKDLLSLCRDSKIALRIKDESSPMVFEAGDNICVIMPMHLYEWQK